MKGKNKKETPSIYLTARRGAEKILWNIRKSPFDKRFLLKNISLFAPGRYHESLAGFLEFFIPAKEQAESISGFEDMFGEPPEGIESPRAMTGTETGTEAGAVAAMGAASGTGVASGTGTMAGLDENLGEANDSVLILMKGMEGAAGRSASLRILLEIREGRYRVPFQIRLLPYAGKPLRLMEREVEDPCWGDGKLSYYTFSPEEYVCRCFHEILSGLELIPDLSWYKDIYDVLAQEPMNGRKVWESFSHVLAEDPIPSVEKRICEVSNYGNHGYMKKRWKGLARGERQTYPPWEKVIALLSAFFTPVYESILKDEPYLGDWMPQIGRYLE